MSNYFRALGTAINPLMINGVEQDLIGKIATITQTQSNDWSLLWEGTQQSFMAADYGSSDVYNGKIHILGVGNNMGQHYTWDGENLVNVNNTQVEHGIPPYYIMGCAVVTYHDEIHIFGGSSLNNKKTRTCHYKWNDTTSLYEEVSKIPYSFNNGTAIVMNDEIHLLGGDHSSSTKKVHYIWNGSGWRKGSSLKLPIVGKHMAYITICTDKSDDLNYGKDILHIISYDTKKKVTKRWVLFQKRNKKGKIVDTWEQEDNVGSGLDVGSIKTIGNQVHVLADTGHYIGTIDGLYGPFSFRKATDDLPYGVPHMVNYSSEVNIMDYDNSQYLIYSDDGFHPIWAKDVLYSLTITEDV